MTSHLAKVSLSYAAASPRLSLDGTRDQGAVLFFDEADSLLFSKRVATGEFCSTSINQNRNKLMQELDRIDGVVIVRINLFENYDSAQPG